MHRLSAAHAPSMRADFCPVAGLVLRIRDLADNQDDTTESSGSDLIILVYSEPRKGEVSPTPIRESAKAVPRAGSDKTRASSIVLNRRSLRRGRRSPQACNSANSIDATAPDAPTSSGIVAPAASALDYRSWRPRVRCDAPAVHHGQWPLVASPLWSECDGASEGVTPPGMRARVT